MSENHEPSPVKGFTDVDGHEEAPRLVDAMDATQRWPAVQALHAWTAPFLTGHDSVLDVGCGTGWALLAIASEHPGGRHLGIDASEVMVSEANQRAAAAGIDAEFRAGDAQALEVGDDEFGAVRAERVLQWLADPRRAVGEMVRVARPGGRIVLLDTDWRTFGSTIDPELSRRLEAGGSPHPAPHVGGFLRHYLASFGVTDLEAHAEVHHATTWAGDGTDGLPPDGVMAEARIARGIDPADAEAAVAQLHEQSDAGTLSITLTMWAATGVVPA